MYFSLISRIRGLYAKCISLSACFSLIVKNSKVLTVIESLLRQVIPSTGTVLGSIPSHTVRVMQNIQFLRFRAEIAEIEASDWDTGWGSQGALWQLRQPGSISQRDAA